MKLDKKRAERRNQLIDALKHLLPDILCKYPTITRLWIIGSIAKPIFFDMRSDMDIVVDGLPNDKYFEMHCFLERELSVSVDLIMYKDLENEDPYIKKERIVIYEKTAKRSKADSQNRS